MIDSASIGSVEQIHYTKLRQKFQIDQSENQRSRSKLQSGHKSNQYGTSIDVNEKNNYQSNDPKSEKK